MRPMPIAAACLSMLLAGPALAAGAADGAWNCDLDGTALGAVGFDGNSYVFANPNGQSGRGKLVYQAGADAPSVVVLDGPLIAIGILGGWLDASIPSEPYLHLVDAVGNQALCTPRR
jgi:hypothetical protein